MKTKAIIAILFGVACELAHAGQTPRAQVVEPRNPSEGRDPRIRVVQYDPDRVVTIYTDVGNPTIIQFEKDEQIVQTPEGQIGVADKKAWITSPKANHIMMLPKAKKPDTKMLVVTNKRTYVFEIISVTPTMRVEPTLALRFEYPDVRAKQVQLEAAKRAAVEDRLQEIAAKTDGKAGRTPGRNDKYSKRGDAALSPSRVEDDGRFTFFRFDSTRELPNVYKVLPDGREALLNFHVDPDTGTVIVHETRPLFILRYGNAVMAIRNDAYDPDAALNPAGTTLSHTLRLTKEPE
jgi:type IV secretion system protein VirB9